MRMKFLYTECRSTVFCLDRYFTFTALLLKSLYTTVMFSPVCIISYQFYMKREYKDWVYLVCTFLCACYLLLEIWYLWTHVFKCVHVLCPSDVQFECHYLTHSKITFHAILRIKVPNCIEIKGAQRRQVR